MEFKVSATPGIRHENCVQHYSIFFFFLQNNQIHIQSLFTCFGERRLGTRVVEAHKVSWEWWKEIF